MIRQIMEEAERRQDWRARVHRKVESFGKLLERRGITESTQNANAEVERLFREVVGSTNVSSEFNTAGRGMAGAVIVPSMDDIESWLKRNGYEEVHLPGARMFQSIAGYVNEKLGVFVNLEPTDSGGIVALVMDAPAEFKRMMSKGARRKGDLGGQLIWPSAADPGDTVH